MFVKELTICCLQLPTFFSAITTKINFISYFGKFLFLLWGERKNILRISVHELSKPNRKSLMLEFYYHYISCASPDATTYLSHVWCANNQDNIDPTHPPKKCVWSQSLKLDFHWYCLSIWVDQKSTVISY